MDRDNLRLQIMRSDDCEVKLILYIVHSVDDSIHCGGPMWARGARDGTIMSRVLRVASRLVYVHLRRPSTQGSGPNTGVCVTAGPATVNVSFDEKRVAFLQEHA